MPCIPARRAQDTIDRRAPRSRGVVPVARASPSRGSANRLGLALAAGIVGRPPHAFRPFRVVMPHPDLVVDRAVLLATLQHPTAIGSIAHRPALPMHRQQILVEIAAEGAPNHVVIENALIALFFGVALQTQAAE